MDPILKNKIDRRQITNRQILDHVSNMIELYPDLRFHQILHSLSISTTKVVGDTVVIVDQFNEESVDTLDRMKTTFTLF